MDSGVGYSRNNIPRIPGDTKAERMETKANRAASITSSDMIKSLDVKAAKQTKKFDYSPQFPAIWQLNDIPFIGSGDLHNTGSTVTNAYPIDARYILFKNAISNFFERLVFRKLRESEGCE
jgi:hypothetical protein